MDIGDVPVWAQQIGAVIGTGVVAGCIALRERKKEKSDAPPAPLPGDAQVVAASFVDKRVLGDLTTAVTGLHGEMIVVSGHLKAINERLHEDEIVRAAVARMKEERR